MELLTKNYILLGHVPSLIRDIYGQYLLARAPCNEHFRHRDRRLHKRIADIGRYSGNVVTRVFFQFRQPS